MTRPRRADYLEHMLEAANEIQTFTDGQSREIFLADRRTRQAVVMNLLIIGEATAKIVDSDPAFARAYPEVPWRSMRGMRTGWRTAISRPTTTSSGKPPVPRSRR